MYMDVLPTGMAVYDVRAVPTLQGVGSSRAHVSPSRQFLGRLMQVSTSFPISSAPISYVHIPCDSALVWNFGSEQQIDQSCFNEPPSIFLPDLHLTPRLLDLIG